MFIPILTPSPYHCPHPHPIHADLVPISISSPNLLSSSSHFCLPYPHLHLVSAALFPIPFCSFSAPHPRLIPHIYFKQIIVYNPLTKFLCLISEMFELMHYMFISQFFLHIYICQYQCHFRLFIKCFSTYYIYVLLVIKMRVTVYLLSHVTCFVSFIVNNFLVLHVCLMLLDVCLYSCLWHMMCCISTQCQTSFSSHLSSLTCYALYISMPDIHQL